MTNLTPLVCLCLVLALSLDNVNAYPSGAPTSACFTMQPNPVFHGPGSNEPSPYTLEFEPKDIRTYGNGEVYNGK